MVEEKEKNPNEILVSFGDVFEHTYKGKTGKSVIVSTGEGNWCSSNDIREENGILFVSPVGGTTDFSDIHCMLDEKLTLEEIIQGMKNCWKKTGITEEKVELLTEYSKKPSAVLTK